MPSNTYVTMDKYNDCDKNSISYPVVVEGISLLGSIRPPYNPSRTDPFYKLPIFEGVT
jgi:hypothetical protein